MLRRFVWLSAAVLCAFMSSAAAEDDLGGQVLPFSLDTVDVQGRGTVIYAVTTGGLRGDWAATATAIAESAVRGGAAFVKVDLLLKNRFGYGPPLQLKHLATVYYGPDPKTSPWPTEPFAILLVDRASTERELEIAADYRREVDAALAAGRNVTGAEHIASRAVSRRFQLSTNWALPERQVVKIAADPRSIGVSLSNEAKPQLEGVSQCVRARMSAIASPACPAP